jgi:NAD(P)H-hydrate epimerase
MSYIAETGIGVPIVSAAQMREIDRIAVEETGPNLFQMMEHAGRSLAELAIEHLGRDWQKRTVLVLAGAGGNGGGGICAARHLANRGARVVVCLADADHLAPVPALQREVFRATSGREIRPDELEHVDADLILDALVG